MNLPKFLKEIWLYFTHYYRYTINMNSFVMNNSFSSKIVILDRYIYDLWAKDKVKRELSSLTISFVYNIFVELLSFQTRLILFMINHRIYIKKRVDENSDKFFSDLFG